MPINKTPTAKRRPLNIIFAGTPELSVPALQTLLNSVHHVIAVYTQPDRPAGRGRKLTASPVKQLALQADLPVYQPDSLKTTEAQAALAELNADVMIVVAYGLILPKTVLEMPTYGCLNIHASLLPRWRGAAPIQRAIQMGDSETGVTIMQMDEGLDTGAMLTTLTTPIRPEDTAQSLHDRLSQLGSEALMQTLDALQADALKPIPQPTDAVTYAEKLTKAEAEIDWKAPAVDIVRQIHAFNPWPVAFSYFQGQPLRIWQATLGQKTLKKPPGLVISVTKQGIEVAAGKGSLWITQLQPAGKKAMSAYDFAQARQLIGQAFGINDDDN